MKFLLALGFLLVAVPALAAPTPTPEEARQLYDRGLEWFKRGDYHHASDLFEQAYVADGLPEYLYGLAECMHKLGNFDGAIKTYSAVIEALKNDPSDTTKQRAQIAAKIEQVRADKSASEVKPEVKTAALTTTAPAGTPMSISQNQTVNLTVPPADKSPRWVPWVLGFGSVIVIGAVVGITVGVVTYDPTPSATTALGTAKVNQ